MNRIKLLREENNWTQEYLGNLLNVKKAAISKYETGRAALTDDTICRLVDIFHVSADYLLGLSDKRNNLENNLTERELTLLGYFHDLTPKYKDIAIGTLASLTSQQDKTPSYKKEG
ncbi:helix-turn-helix domain-containing protein [Anaerocolumna sp. MB42-C2]|uniref:helix-turn-helix domain-containing protein n=1 Tax=Anaerocolumna sp. MB42-C2 TaxID=3070997 RepID=UPI0027DF0410|nr:helix-turn-helix transcriptional regulator [Anaerocolumna sp. MB42-C2]WMJ85802.1 helix-turn-helix transcriptional regulator [Anaerocolumna sp. MB42-C2]